MRSSDEMRRLMTKVENLFNTAVLTKMCMWRK